MPITNTDLKRALGRKYDPEATYSLHDNWGALAKTCACTHKVVGKIQTSGDGEMIVLQELNPDQPKQTILSKLRGVF